MENGIDPTILANLMQGLFTCYWCGEVEDGEQISEHVDRCLEEVNWLRQHVERVSGI
jgi:hypothetical protein